MIFPEEIQQLHKNILEYLNFGKFENTFECFDSEIRAKVVSQKLLQSRFDLTDEATPELFRVMKGITKDEVKRKKAKDELSERTEQYLDLLAGTRQMFSLIVKLMDYVGKQKKVSFTPHSFIIA